jgi:hypothetical protein
VEPVEPVADPAAAPPAADRSDVAEPGPSLDQLSLEQALIDLEIANARVIDLTARLNQSGDELLRLRAELAQAKGLRGQFDGLGDSAVRALRLVRRRGRALARRVLGR